MMREVRDREAADPAATPPGSQRLRGRVKNMRSCAMTWSLLEMARSLRTCPWTTLARSRFALPASEALPADLEGLRAPWAAMPNAAAPTAGLTWMPLLGRVPWSAEPSAFTHGDPLTSWMRTRLTDAFHAARVALLSGEPQAARMAIAIIATLGTGPWDRSADLSHGPVPNGRGAPNGG